VDSSRAVRRTQRPASRSEHRNLERVCGAARVRSDALVRLRLGFPPKGKSKPGAARAPVRTRAGASCIRADALTSLLDGTRKAIPLLLTGSLGWNSSWIRTRPGLLFSPTTHLFLPRISSVFPLNLTHITNNSAKSREPKNKSLAHSKEIMSETLAYRRGSDGVI